jgi:hypothetical protein
MAVQNDDASDVTNVAAGAVNVDAAVAGNAGLRLMGYSIKETAAVAAQFEVVHGATGAGGTGLGADHNLAANGDVAKWFGPKGIKIPNGLSVKRTAGTAKLALYTKIVI